MRVGTSFLSRHRCARRALACFVLAGAGAWLLPSRAAAQLSSDVVPFDRIVPIEEEVKADIDAARFRLGPVRLIPGFAVTDAGYDSNVYGSSTDIVADWTATVKAGARFLVPFGSKIVFRADAFPQYTWYADLAERRFFGGEYTASLFGFFNRLSFELVSAYFQRYRIYSSELDSRVFSRTTVAAGNVELELAGPFYLFATGDYARVRSTQEGASPGVDVTLNDRDQYAAGGGIRYRVSPSWNVSAAVAQSWDQFVTTGPLRDNQSTVYLAGFEYNQPRLFVNLSGGYRQGRADNGSAFPEYSTAVGSGFVSFFPFRFFELRVNGRRRITYSLSDFNSYFFENRIGGSINIELFQRVLLKGFGETGPNNYPVAELVGEVPVKRRDDTYVYGGGLSARVFRNVVFTGLVSRIVYNSNVPGNNRDFTRFTAFLAFGGEYVR